MFVPWRLFEKIETSSDEYLEAAIEVCESLGLICAGFVICGVVGEFVIAWFDPPYGSGWQRWGGVAAGCAVAVGVAGEVLFGRLSHSRTSELSRRAKEALAEALSVAEEGRSWAEAAGADAEKAQQRAERAWEEAKVAQGVDIWNPPD